MNKQEAIKRVEGLLRYGSRAKVVTDIISQIHEPQKVVVPKHIADKIEYCKDVEGYGLFHAMDYCYQYKDSAEWLECNQETFARAWLDGYTIEQERLYTVEIPNPNNTSPKYKLMLIKGINGVEILRDYYNEKRDPYIFQLTESEIKEDFEWAWQFREEVD